MVLGSWIFTEALKSAMDWVTGTATVIMSVLVSSSQEVMENHPNMTGSSNSLFIFKPVSYSLDAG